MTRIRFSFVVLALFTALPAFSAQDVAIPDELTGWQDWVLHGEEYRRCPFLVNGQPGDKNAHVCAWPGLLEINATRDGAQFKHSWRVLEDSWVRLPGDARHWPSDVLVNGSRTSVRNENNAPVLWLEPGSYDIAGRIRWSTRPTQLALPPAAGLVRLSVDGSEVAQPRFDGNSVWLGEPPQQQASEADSLKLQVYRLVTDELPLTLQTNLRLDVAGKNREVELGTALPPGFVPMTLQSPMPARLTVDGKLTIQLTAGSHEVSFSARAKTATNEVSFQSGGEDWPDSEVWSYQSVEQLRISEPTGGEPINPSVSGTPWQSLPAFVMTDGQSLTIEEKSRGMAGDERNELSLNRQLWLDFDGAGFTARDSVSGLMRSGWRLDIGGPYSLEEASLGGAPLLVTRSPDEDLSGIELRDTNVSVAATSRIDEPVGALPVAGWREQFSNVTTTLNVPPGYRLLAAPGSDSASGAWIERWRLLDIFIALLVAVAVSRILSIPAGIATLVMMVLTYHEPGALRWSWVSLVAAIGLVRAAPEGRLRRIATSLRNISFVALALLALPFAADQLRMTLFPQLETTPLVPVLAPAAGMRDAMIRVNEFEPEMSQRLEKFQTEGAMEADVQAMKDLSNAPPKAKKLSRYAPDALVQSGTGRPSWGWRSHRLSWRGPVIEGQTFRMIIAPRWVTAVWHVLGVGLLALVAWWLAKSSFGGPPRQREPVQAGAATAAMSAIIAAVFISLSAAPLVAKAETPAPELLEELKRRLNEPPECVPDCAEIITARIDVADDRLTVGLEVHAHADVAFPLPGSVSGFRPQRINVDGSRLDRFYQQGGSIWLALDAGVHVISVTGQLPPLNAVQVPFPEQPRFVEVSARDWDVEGVVQNRLQRGSVTLRRRATAETEPTTALTPDQFPAFVRVVRDIALDLDWTVRTRVTRIAPGSGAITMRLPLLPGEQVLTEGLAVEDGHVRIALGATQRWSEFSSSLPREDTFTLTAGDMDRYAETWRLNVSPVWRVEHSGLPAVLPVNRVVENYLPEFRPLPGESLAVAVTRPEAVPGDTLAIDVIRQSIDIGKRARSVNAELSIRSTRGGTHEMTLPDGAELERVTVDGETLLLRLVDNKLAIPFEPGQHQVQIAWRETAPIGAVSKASPFDPGAAVSNVTTSMTLPENRWTLMTFGPRLGPAVLLWAELVVFGLIAFWLGRSGFTPLKSVDWLLLGLGLSTISWSMLLVFGAWILALSFWQRREPILPRRWFNASFALLGVASVLVLIALLFTVPEGLLGRPDMHITGNDSSASILNWFTDRAAGILPQPSAITIPLWAYKALLLLWALWLSFALIRWLKWAWTSWTSHGYWRGKVKAQSHGN